MNSEFLVTELHGRHEMYNKVVEIVVLLRGMSAQGAGPGVLFDFVYYFIFDFIIIIIILFYTKPWLLNYPSWGYHQQSLLSVPNCFKNHPRVSAASLQTALRGLLLSLQYPAWPHIFASLIPLTLWGKTFLSFALWQNVHSLKCSNACQKKKKNEQSCLQGSSL